MDAFILVVLLFLLGGWIFGIAGFARAGGARRQAELLRAEVAGLRAEVAGMAAALIAAGFRPPGAAGPVSVAEQEEGAAQAPAPGPVPEAAPAGAPGMAAPAAAPEAPQAAGPLPPWARPAGPKPERNIEELLTQRWGVWLGAGALLLAAVFLIRFAVEEGWLGPGARCALAALLGAALILGGEWLARRPVPERAGALPDYAPPALAAGGVAALFGAAYAATAMYALLPPLVGFAAMAAAGVFGLLLSLRRGPLVAVVGLAGAFLTPALVQTEDPSLPGLFAYLLVVTAAAMAVVRMTAWGWLGWCATAAGAVWVLAGTAVGQGLDLWAPALFVPLAAACFLFLLPREALGSVLGRRLAHVPPALLAAALLPLAVLETDLAPAVGMLLLSPVAIAAGLRDARLARLPWIAAGLGLLLLLVWLVPSWSPTGEPVTIEGAVQAVIPGAWVPEALTRYLTLAIVFALLHLLAGLAIEARGGLAWAGLAASVPVLTLLVAYARVRGFATDPNWGLAACAVAAVHVGAVARGMRAGDAGRAGLHAAGATAALALGAAMVLREQWLTLAVALFLPPLAMIARRAGLEALRRVAAAVAAVVLVRLVLNRFVLGYDWGTTPVLNGLLLGYGVPALGFWWAAREFLRMRDGFVVRLLECGAALFGTLLVLLEIRHATHGGDMLAEYWGFLEAGLQLTALFACAWVALLLHWRLGRIAMLWSARAACMAGLVLGLILLVANPWQANEEIGPVPLLNALLPAYGLPALLVALAVMRAPQARQPPGMAHLLSAYTLVAAFAWVTLEVRRAFHPVKFGTAPVEEAEMYAYSGAWLVFGAALVAIGIRSGRKEIRLAALAVIALTTFKVFLWDMEALVGLWRVLSFLGLGLALIALGAIYRRFVVTRPVTPAGGAAPPA
ncbi:DUF2339 domain-containing protein [Roseomonas eburnea]|uniref:DUF2339 domain-containing protein n=1 Tax=Neoroseomonas eburnea TaxID=1346889 RepID=A0A9X9XE85_9PROT|nr:DUF2339 domain-containing protein [Neoroseomonas eburnea]MBR0682021.1 DUF2339 domain-containing protein [Neoroseomonas eburnea]